MLKRFRAVVNDLVLNQDEKPRQSFPFQPALKKGRLRSKLEYQRPLFLGLSKDEEEIALNCKLRHPTTPSESSPLPFNAGYCEIVNGGKSLVNEDQAVAITINFQSSSIQQHRTAAEPVVQTANTSKDNTIEPSSGARSCDETDVVEGSESQFYEDAYGCMTHTDRPFTGDYELATTVYTTPYETVEEKSSCKYCSSPDMRVDYFAIFDGHAGTGAALYASTILHQILFKKLDEIHSILKENCCQITLPSTLPEDRNSEKKSEDQEEPQRVSNESLLVGVLQDVMVATDKHMAADRHRWQVTGGCAALLIVFIMGKVYVAGAGDCRAVLCRHNADNYTVLSQDFTPSTERRRLQYLAYMNPSLLGNMFTRLEFIRRLSEGDIGKKVLYRDYHMSGWAYKEVAREDLLPQMLSTAGKSGRLLSTIGVTRGLGDHDIIALNRIKQVPIKPFLSSAPEVHIYDTRSCDHDVVILAASDGLWDVTPSDVAAQLVASFLETTDRSDPTRYQKTAEMLAMRARGELDTSNTEAGTSSNTTSSHMTASSTWKMKDGSRSSVDDISVFVIPLAPFASS